MEKDLYILNVVMRRKRNTRVRAIESLIAYVYLWRLP
jgi:hypothetical protein